MEKQKENIISVSEFDASAVHKVAILLYYPLMFMFSAILSLPILFEMPKVAILIVVLATVIMGGIIHAVIYFGARNNEIVLTNYKITGTYNRRLSLNIPIDSVTSVTKGFMSSLCITCAGNKYNIAYVGNRDEFCQKLNEVLNQRTHNSLNSRPVVIAQQSSLDDIAKLKQLLDCGAITREEFEAKKNQILGL